MVISQLKFKTEARGSLIPFSGKSEEWVDWESKFLAIAFISGYDDVLEEGGVAIPKDKSKVPGESNTEEKVALQEW